MVTLDDQVTIISIGVVLLIVLNMAGGISFHDLLSPLTTSWAKSLFGIDLYGIETMIVLSIIILFFESNWRILGNPTMALLFIGLIYVLSVIKG